MVAPALVACALLLSQVPQGPPVPPASPKGTAVIRGRVVAADTGRPIADAEVMLAPDLSEWSDPAANDRSTTGSTGRDGAFEFPNLRAGRYMLLADAGEPARNYLPATYGEDVQPLGIAIALADGQVFDKVTIRLRRGGVMAGRVVDEFGQPLANIAVRPLAYSHRGAEIGGQPVTTDDRGAFRLYGLREGDWSIFATASDVGPGITSEHASGEPEPPRDAGFLDTYYPNAAAADAAQRVSLAKGQEVDDLVVQMRYGRLYKIGGVVFDPAGRPFGHARVALTVERDGSRQGSDQIEADASGRFMFTNVTAGRYAIDVTNPPAPENVPSPEPLIGIGRAAVTVVDRDVTDLAIATSAGADITGEVLFEPMMPPDVQELSVDAEAADGAHMPVLSRASLDGQGRLTFGLQHLVGPLSLRLPELRPSWYVRSLSVNGVELAEPSHEFHSGDRITIVISTMAATVAGHVTTATGEPAARFIVFLLSPEKTWDPVLGKRPAFTAPDGAFEIPGVPPGQYYVAAVNPADDTQMPNDPDPLLHLLAADAVPVSVAEGARTVVDIRIKNRKPQ